MTHQNRHPSTTNELETAIQNAQRWLRYTYAQHHWPQINQTKTWTQEIPAHTVIQTMTTELEKLTAALENEREGRQTAEQAVTRFVATAKQVCDVAGRVSTQGTLGFDAA